MRHLSIFLSKCPPQARPSTNIPDAFRSLHIVRNRAQLCLNRQPADRLVELIRRDVPSGSSHSLGSMFQSGVSAFIFFFRAEYCGLPVKFTVSAALRFGRLVRGGLGEMARFLRWTGELYWTSSEPEEIVSRIGDYWLRKAGKFLTQFSIEYPPGSIND